MAMRPASLWILLLLGCRASAAAPTPAGSAVQASDAGAPPVARRAPRPFIAIASFDCEKVIDLPGVAAPAGAIPAARGIRAWHGGGPGGANWNVTDLRCVVRIDTRCTAGKVGVALRVGQHVVGEKQVDVRTSPFDVELSVAQKQWQRALDQPTKRTAAGLPFRTGIFRAMAVTDCSAPEEVSIKSWAYLDAAADAAFVAGFASGE